MKSTKKVILAAGVICQLAASLHADNWSDAFAAFGGPDAVYNNRNSMPWTSAQKIAQGLGTVEAMSVGLYESKGNLASNQGKFPGALPSATVYAQLQNAANSRQQIPVDQPVVVSPVPVVGQQDNSGPGVQQQPPSTSLWSSWFGSASSQSSDNAAAIQQAVAAQQQADTIAMQQAVAQQMKLDSDVATKNSQALLQIANSGAQGADLYNAYIDLIFSSLQQAVAGIADAAVQQQVIAYAQNKLAGMQAAAGANSYNSRVLGPLSSKKEAKKNKSAKKARAA